MILYACLPIVAGILAVLQANLNQRIASVWGLSGAVFINSAAIIVFSAIFLGAVWYFPQIFSEGFRMPETSKLRFEAWYLIPAFCGFFFVCALPLALNRLGATQVFVLVVAAQILSSMAWDRFIGNQELSLQRFIGAGLAIAGALLVSL